MHEQTQITLEQEDKIEEYIRKFDERLREVILEFLDLGQTLKYNRIAKRMDIYYPGITKEELYEHSSDVIDTVLRRYDEFHEKKR